GRRVAVHEDERRALAHSPAIDLGAGHHQRLPPRRLGDGGGGASLAGGEELHEEGDGDDEVTAGQADRCGEDQGNGEREEPGYFRLTHFTRRHPLNRLTLTTSSGASPTCSSSGIISRFDFQPRRVHTGAIRSSMRPGSRRSLRK